MKPTPIMKNSIVLFLSRICAAAVCVTWLGLAAPQAGAQSTSNPPGKMSYQGFLTDDTGVPLGSTAPLNRDIVFRLFTAPTGGTLKWAEQQTVTLDKGFFAVQLGEGSGVASSPFTNNLSSLFIGADASDRYLEITVKGTGGGADLTVSPRVQLLTSPYAFLARNALTMVSSAGQALVTTSGTSVGINLSGTPAATLEVNGDVKAASFTGSGAGLTGISTAALADGSVTKVKVATDAVGSSEIAEGAVRSNEILDGTIAAVDLAANSVDSAAIASGAVGTSEIADQSIQSIDISSGAVGSSEIRDQGIQSIDISPDAIGSSEIRADAVSSSEIEDGSITAADMASSVGVWTKSGVNHYVTGGAEVGINTTSPGRPLHVTATATTTSGANYLCLRLEAGPAADYWDIGMDNDDGESGDDADLVFLYKGTEKGYLDATSGGFLIGSDRRLKKDIETVPREALDKVMKIPVVRFRMMDQSEDAPKQIGIIAQDLQAFYPELVDEHRGTLSVGYDRIGVISMAAIQELKNEKDAEIEDLKVENASLKQQMAQILERLKVLEQKGR